MKPVRWQFVEAQMHSWANLSILNRDLRIGCLRSNWISNRNIRIESFQLQRILITKISNYKWSKRDVCNYIFLITVLKTNTLNYRCVITHGASLYTVPLSAVNGSSRLTQLTTSKGAGTADSIRKFGQSLSNRIGRQIRIRIESWSFAGP